MVINTLYTPTDKKIAHDEWRPSYTQSQIASFEPDLSNVTFNESIRGFKVDGSNLEQITQFGRALAIQFADVWELMENTADLPPATYILARCDGKRAIEATVYDVITKDEKTIKYADLFERGDDGKWVQHPMMYGRFNVIRRTLNSRVDKTQSIVCYTKYHLLVKLIQNTQIVIINGDSGTIDRMVDAFRSELSILSGYAWKSFQEVIPAA